MAISDEELKCWENDAISWRGGRFDWPARRIVQLIAEIHRLKNFEPEKCECGWSSDSFGGWNKRKSVAVLESEGFGKVSRHRPSRLGGCKNIYSTNEVEDSDASDPDPDYGF